MKRLLLASALAASVAVGVIAASAPAASTASNVYTFSTSTNPVSPGSNNQGWWGETGGVGNSNSNDNYYVGWGANTKRYNNYFTFDISSITNPCPPQAAYIRVPRGSGGGASTATYTLHDVSTPPSVLAHKVNGPSQTIYNDLGGGAVYGSYVLSTAAGAPFTLTLNGNALSALLAAEQSHAPSFSVGGSLGNPPAGVFLFGSTGGVGSTVTLTVTYPKLCRVF
jgi:hypothetical protein